MWPFRHKWSRKMREHRANARKEEQEIERMVLWAEALPPERVKTAVDASNEGRCGMGSCCGVEPVVEALNEPMADEFKDGCKDCGC